MAAYYLSRIAGTPADCRMKWWLVSDTMFSKMTPHMRDFSKIIRSMVWVLSSGLTVTFILELLNMIREMDPVKWHFKMEMSIMVVGKMIKCMDSVWLCLSKRKTLCSMAAGKMEFWLNYYSLLTSLRKWHQILQISQNKFLSQSRQMTVNL